MKEQEINDEWENLEREAKLLAARWILMMQTMDALPMDGMPVKAGTQLLAEMRALRKELIHYRHRIAKLYFLVKQKNQLRHLN